MSLHPCVVIASMGLLLASSSIARCGEEPAERTIRFARGQWDANAWQPIRMANQDAPRTFTQHDEFIGVTAASFREDDYVTERDNAVLLTDTRTTEGEIEVIFRGGEGLTPNGYSAPGILIAPLVVDGCVEKAIGIFVGDYATAVWLIESDKPKRLVTYAHLGQLARTSDPTAKHTLRCRFSKREASIAVQIDDSDVLVFQFLGNPALSKVAIEMNSLVCLVGCHGVSEFYQMTIRPGGTLPFVKRYEAPEPPR